MGIWYEIENVLNGDVKQIQRHKKQQNHMTDNQSSSKNPCEYIISQEKEKSTIYYSIICIYVLQNACILYTTFGLGPQFT